jgi:hypothetical protein
MLGTIRCFARNVSLATAAVCVLGAAAWAGEEEPIRSFGAVQKIFTESCALTTCHSSVARQGNLILEHEDLSYANLVDQESFHPDAQRQRILRVQSGSPGNSFLIRKLRGLGPGDPMPQTGGMLAEETIKMIEDWITRGAHTRAEECVTTAPPEPESGQAASRRQLPSSGRPAHGLHIDPKLCSDQPVVGEFDWEPQPPLEVPAPGTGVQMYVPPRDVAPGTEWETCYAFRLKDLPNYDQLPSTLIEHQEYRMHEGSHHLLLYMYFGSHPEQFKEGYFDCVAGNCVNDEDCPEDSGMLQIPIGGTQVAGTRYVVTYPPGVGLPVLGNENAVMIANLHYHNPFQPQQPIYGEAWINLYFYQPDQFKAILDGIFAINSGDLIVEPYTTKTIKRYWRPRSFLGGELTGAAVFQLFGHMHKRGRSFDIEHVSDFCTGDCNADGEIVVSELVSGVNVALGNARLNRCGAADFDRDGEVGIAELISSVDHSLSGCSATPLIYRTTEWDNAPVQEYGNPFLTVDVDQALRWTCVHENGRLLDDGEEDPTYPAKKCHEGCNACGWDDDSRTCRFTRDGSDRVFQEGEPMPLVFGLLADDDMCNMFGYFIRQEDLPKL